MKIRYRIVDIKILQTRILQDYFRMALAEDFADDEWKPLFYQEVQKGKESQYSGSYVGAWEKMQSKGLDDYLIDDMDSTIIIAILKGPKQSAFGCCKFDKINQYLDYLQEDRNIDAHSNSNESDSELLQFAYGSLHSISRFLLAVSKAKWCKISEDKRNLYARKYLADVEHLRLQFESDFKEAFKVEEIDLAINRDIERIKSNSDPFRTYVEIQGKYLNNRTAEGKPDVLLHRKFIYAAADAGIIWACPMIGDYHFEGLLTNVDYKKAADYYEKGFEHLVPMQKLRLASLYLNNLSGSPHSKEEAMIIIKSCESKRWEIFTYISEDGYTFYSQRRIYST